MLTSVIRKQIARAVAHEQFSGSARQMLRQFAAARGVDLDPLALEQTVTFIRRYIEHVPALLDGCYAAASQAGVAKHVQPIIEAALQYFHSPLDVIFDHFGLLGLMDDAYFAQRLLQAVSDAHELRTGSALLPMDLRPANDVIRQLIGDPQGHQLDMAVQATLQQPEIRRAFRALTEFGAELPVNGSVWQDADIERLVSDRADALGLAGMPPRAPPVVPVEQLAAELEGDEAAVEAAGAPSIPADAAPASAYLVLAKLFDDKVAAGELALERQQSLHPVLAEIASLLEERPADVTGQASRAARIRELMSQATHDLAGAAEAARPLPPDSRAARVAELLGEAKRYLFVAGGRSSHGEKERAATESLMLRCASAGLKIRAAAGDDEATYALERETIRKLALDVRGHALRRHLTLARPVWPAAPVAQDPNTVYFAGGEVVRNALLEACAGRRLNLRTAESSADYSLAAWDELRRCNVAALDLTLAGARKRAGICYELGIALALGRSPMVIVSRGASLPFDIDLVPAPVGLERGARAVETFAKALDEALYRTLGVGCGSSIAASVRQAREMVPRGTLRLDPGRDLEPLHNAESNATRAATLLEEMLAAAVPDAPTVLYPSWPGSYPEPGARRCCHIAPRGAEAGEAVAALVADICAAHNLHHTRAELPQGRHNAAALWNRVCRASHLVFDLTGFDEGIALALGMANALGRNALIIAQEGTAQQPFPALTGLPVHRYGGTRDDSELRRILYEFLSRSPD